VKAAVAVAVLQAAVAEVVQDIAHTPFCAVWVFEI
jgi:hypothetical protein